MFRTRAPRIKTIKKLSLPQPQVFILDSGVPVHVINLGTEEVLKLEIVFQAGRPFEQTKLAARATAALLKEGTPSKNSAEIAEMIDFYGGTISTPFSFDTSNVILYSLNKHFEKLLPILAEIIEMPSFPQNELDTFIATNQRSLQIELTKTDIISYRKITELMFGEEHPYGWNSTAELYEQINRNDLVAHFEKNYTKENCHIFISGKVDDKILATLNKYLSTALRSGKKNKIILPETIHLPQKIKIEHKDTTQTSIKIGRSMFNRHHPDFVGVFLLNTILGGYFGSRLMSNIREKKGYTYNISSSIEAMAHGGYFCVSTEVGNEFTKDTLKQIYREMEILQQKLIPKTELKMVRNYLMGNLLNMLDGPFNVADVVRMHVVENMSFDNFDKMVETINTISQEELRLLAQKYFNRADLWEVIVGK